MSGSNNFDEVLVADIRTEITRQAAAINIKLFELDHEAAVLEDKSQFKPLTAKERTRLESLNEKRTRLRGEASELDKVYLDTLGKLLRVPELLEKLKRISSKLESNAAITTSFTKRLFAADAMIGLAASSVDQIRQAFFLESKPESSLRREMTTDEPIRRDYDEAVFGTGAEAGGGDELIELLEQDATQFEAVAQRVAALANAAVEASKRGIDRIEQNNTRLEAALKALQSHG